MRYVVRPSHILTTPRVLARAMGAKRTLRWPSKRIVPSYQQDFLLVYPANVTDGPEKYQELRAFSNSNKLIQRRYLHDHDIPVPTGEAEEYVVRPLRHSQGQGWRLTDNPEDYDKSSEYISPLIKKEHEYRVVYCFGTPLFTLLKRRAEGLTYRDPWNHQHGSTFVTVEDPNNNRLRHTDVVERLEQVPVVQHAHLCAADVLFTKEKQAFVCELNFCPSLTIQGNVAKVVSFLEQRKNV
jgi:hypothetical protein